MSHTHFSSTTFEAAVIVKPYRVIFRCCECGTPFAEIIDGSLLIRSHHRGTEHVNTVALSALLRHLPREQLQELLRLELEK